MDRRSFFAALGAVLLAPVLPTVKPRPAPLRFRYVMATPVSAKAFLNELYGPYSVNVAVDGAIGLKLKLDSWDCLPAEINTLQNVKQP